MRTMPSQFYKNFLCFAALSLCGRLTFAAPATSSPNAVVHELNADSASVNKSEFKFEVKAWSARLVFVANPTLRNLRVSGVSEEKGEPAWQINRSGNTFRLVGNEAQNKKNPVRTVTVEGPAMNLSVALHEGAIELNNWTSPAKIVLAQGKLSVSNQKAPLMISMQKGDLVLQSIQAATKLDLFNVSANLKEINGDLDWSQQLGSASIDHHQGILNFNSFAANFKSISGQGTIVFEAAKGSVSVYQFSGRIEGQTNEASSNLQLLADSELNLKSNAGKVSIQTPAQSGALLNLLSDEGEIYVPNEVTVRKGSVDKSVKGRLRGGSQKLSLFVRTQSGSITVK